MTHLDDYRQRYENATCSRVDGILEVTLHTDGGPLVWGAGPHRELPRLFGDIAEDRENRVVILTGTGDDFCVQRNPDLTAARHGPDKWDRIFWEGRRLLENLLKIEVPVISAVNGPARYHPEILVLADIVLAAPEASFQDKPHFPSGVMPGDGAQYVWPAVLGPNRGRYFLLMGEELTAEQACALGVVSEVVPRPGLIDRARQIATMLAQRDVFTLRYSRMVLTRRLRNDLPDELSLGLALAGLSIASSSADEH